MDIYDDYSARRLSTTRMDMNTAQVEAQTLENWGDAFDIHRTALRDTFL